MGKAISVGVGVGVGVGVPLAGAYLMGRALNSGAYNPYAYMPRYGGYAPPMINPYMNPYGGYGLGGLSSFMHY
jgi:hypothetical protein